MGAVRWAAFASLLLSCGTPSSGASRGATPVAEPTTSSSAPASGGIAEATAETARGIELAFSGAAASGAGSVVAAAPARRAGAYANLDPTDDFVVGPPEPLTDCEGDLRRAGIRFTRFPLAVHTERQRRASIVCGAPEVVVYLRGPGKIEYRPPPVITCAMALALASFEKVLEEEATRHFQSKVSRIDQLGTYVCREVAAFPGTVSEHSYANAIDIGRFVLASGRTIEIARDFDKSPSDPTRPASAFLRAVSRRANDEDIFSHVLTPFFNATHNNHFHLDLARYRTDGTR